MVWLAFGIIAVAPIPLHPPALTLVTLMLLLVRTFSLSFAAAVHMCCHPVATGLVWTSQYAGHGLVSVSIDGQVQVMLRNLVSFVFTRVRIVADVLVGFEAVKESISEVAVDRCTIK